MNGHEQKDAQLLEKIKATLDANSEHLDQDTVRALRQARENALAQLHKPRRSWQPITGLAVAASVALLTVGVVMLQNDPDATMPNHEDMSLLSAGDDLEFYENLEFYQWLAFEERSS